MSLSYEMLCEELNLPKQKSLSDYVKYDVDLDDYRSVIRFIKFVQEYKISEFRYADSDFLDEHFSGLGGAEAFIRRYNSIIYDHARIIRDKLGFYYLILQPYMNTEDCEDALASSDIKNKYKVLGKGESFHYPNKTNLILIYEDRISCNDTLRKVLGL